MLNAPNLSLQLGRFSISAHFVFESLAYAVGFALYRRDRRRFGDPIEQHDRAFVIVAAILGAAIGSKLLAGLEDPVALKQSPWLVLLAGKTMVGGLLGGTLAVEWVKRKVGIQRRTGDLFVIPMAVAIAIGRVGCFFSGLGDHTYGTPTNMPWGINFGDGIARHPTQLYEIVFLLAFALFLAWLRPRATRNGELFRMFLTGYLTWRLLIDFLKPEPAFFGLSSIQWACVLALLFYARGTVQMFSERRKIAFHG